MRIGLGGDHDLLKETIPPKAVVVATPAVILEKESEELWGVAVGEDRLVRRDAVRAEEEDRQTPLLRFKGISP